MTLQYEMSYTNILDALEMAGIPLRASADRTDGPFVIVGAARAHSTPSRWPTFVDIFVAIGDGERSTHDTIR